MPTIERQIAASSDDADQRLAGGGYSHESQSLVIGKHWDVADDRFIVGLRFTNITIPPGSTVTNATLGLYSWYKSSAANMPLMVCCEDNVNPPTFSESTDVRSRDITLHKTSWNVAGLSWTDQAWNYSPNFSSAVQEVINKPGWVSGNSLVVFVYSDGGDDWNAHSAAAFDGSESTAPTLRIEYTESVPVDPDEWIERDLYAERVELNNKLLTPDRSLYAPDDLYTTNPTPPYTTSDRVWQARWEMQMAEGQPEGPQQFTVQMRGSSVMAVPDWREDPTLWPLLNVRLYSGILPMVQIAHPYNMEKFRMSFDDEGNPLVTHMVFTVDGARIQADKPVFFEIYCESALNVFTWPTIQIDAITWEAKSKIPSIVSNKRIKKNSTFENVADVDVKIRQGSVWAQFL